MLTLMNLISGLLLKHWPLGLGLRGMGRCVEYLYVCPKPVMDSNLNRMGL